MKRLALALACVGLAAPGLAVSAEAAAAKPVAPALVTSPAPTGQTAAEPIVAIAPAPMAVATRGEQPAQSAVKEKVLEDKSETAALKERLARLEAQLKSQGGLLDLLGQIQEMRAEIARLRGAQEELSHSQKLADKRQKELFADLDERQSKLKASVTDLDGRFQELASRALSPKDMIRLQSSQSLATAAPVPDAESEAKAYEVALNQFKVGNYTAAVEAFQAFLKLYPSGAFASNGHYWLGLSYFSLGDYKSAAAAQLRLLRDHPQSHKAPDAMVSLARSQTQLGELDAARNTLEQVLEKYPVTKAADAARKMLALMK